MTVSGMMPFSFTVFFHGVVGFFSDWTFGAIAVPSCGVVVDGLDARARDLVGDLVGLGDGLVDLVGGLLGGLRTGAEAECEAA